MMMMPEQQHHHEHGPGCNHSSEGQQQRRTIQINDANKASDFYKSMCNYLKDTKQSGLKPRQGVFGGRRFEYFKGKRGIDALLAENYGKISKDKKPTNREEATKLFKELHANGFVLRVDRGDPVGGKGSPRELQPNPEQEVKEDGYYMYIWAGPPYKQYMGAVLLVATILAGVLFPLWPSFLRMGVWYLSIAVLCLVGVFFGIAIVRLILYIITLPFLPRGFWIFPNLFADCGVVDSFIPLYGFDPVKENKKGKAPLKEKST